jgi:hypothetical protein
LEVLALSDRVVTATTPLTPGAVAISAPMEHIPEIVLGSGSQPGDVEMTAVSPVLISEESSLLASSDEAV